jgi:hypothetical protein
MARPQALHSSLTFTNRDQSKARRAMILPIFAVSNLAEFEPNLHHLIRHYLRQLAREQAAVGHAECASPS